MVPGNTDPLLNSPKLLKETHKIIRTNKDDIRTRPLASPALLQALLIETYLASGTHRSMGDVADIQDRGRVLRLLWLLLLPNPLLFHLQRLQQSQHNIRDKEKMHACVYVFLLGSIWFEVKHTHNRKPFPSRSWNRPSVVRESNMRRASPIWPKSRPE